MNDKIVNKVAAAGILRLDLRNYMPQEAIVALDIAVFLPEDHIVREQLFAKELTRTDWAVFSGKAVAVHCSADAIIPQWVYLMVGLRLVPYAAMTGYGSASQLRVQLWENNFSQADLSAYYHRKVAVLAHPDIPDVLYVKAGGLLHNKVKSIMYGEPGFPKMIKKY